MVGGTRFYDRREIKDVLAYLKILVNPIDEVSIKRILNVPKRGIGDTTVGRLDAMARAEGIAFIDALRRAPAAGVSGRAVAGIESFLALVDALGERVPSGPATVLEAILERTGYVAELQAEHTIESEGRLENLAELVGAARDFDDVAGFLERVSLVADTDDIPEDDDETSVILMTLHSAKGLEFPDVFLVGLEDGVFPHIRALGEPDELEEERRLAYVGITRAMRRLYLTPRLEPHAVGLDPVQPAEPVPRRDPRGAGRGGAPAAASGGPGPAGARSDGARRRDRDHREPRRDRRAGDAGTGPVAAAERSRGAGPAGRRRRPPRQVGRGRDHRHLRPGRQGRGRRCGSRASARSGCCCRGRPWRSWLGRRSG